MARMESIASEFRTECAVGALAWFDRSLVRIHSCDGEGVQLVGMRPEVR